MSTAASTRDEIEGGAADDVDCDERGDGCRRASTPDPSWQSPMTFVANAAKTHYKLKGPLVSLVVCGAYI